LLKADKKASSEHLKYIAEVYAMLGDEAATRSVFAAMKPDPDRPWVIADDRRDICVALARHAHIEGALACTTQLHGPKPYHKANTVAAYAAILQAAARR
jgi:hypothetical protein